MSDQQRTDCYACKHRRKLVGSAHSECVQPELGEKNPMATLLSMLSRGSPSGVLLIYADAIRSFGIRVRSEDAVNKGWFNWPVDYDPVWLEHCNRFEEKETESK